MRGDGSGSPVAVTTPLFNKIRDLRVCCAAVALLFTAISIDAKSASAADICSTGIDVGILAAQDADPGDIDEHHLAFQKAIFTELTTRTGCHFRLQAEMPRARQWKLFLTGHLPIISAAIAKQERDAAGWYVKYQAIRNVLILRKDHITTTDATAILRDPKVAIGMVRGYSLGRYWDGLLAQSSASDHTEYFVNMATIFHMMDIGRIDAVITSYGVYTDMLPAYRLTDRVTVLDWPAVDDEYSGIYLSKTALPQDVAARIGQAIKAAIADHTLARLYHQVTGSNPEQMFELPDVPLDFSK